MMMMNKARPQPVTSTTMRCLLLLSLLTVGGFAQDAKLPTIEKPQTAQDHYYTRDEKVVLECRANGNPSYKWYRDGNVVKEEKDRDNNQLIGFDSKSGDLNINKYSDRFDGDYFCVAMLQYASSMSQMQRLRETRLPAFIPGKMNTVTRDEYSYVELKCSNQGKVVAAPSDISYNWYLTEETRQMNMEDGRKFIDAEGNLHFTYVVRADTTNRDVRYLCGYSSLRSKNIRMGNENELIINERDPEALKPVFQYSSQGVKAELGTSAQLECFFSGYDPEAANYLPSIKWYDSEQKEIVSDGKHTLKSDNRILEIKDLKEHDDKNYYCKGFTSAGNTDLMSVYLNVTSIPLWVEPPQTQTKAEKSNAVFHCKARSLSKEADPEPPIWFINAERFSSQLNHLRYVMTDDRKTLTIKDLKKPEDVLCIQCKVSNSIGTLMGDACLNVVTPIKLGMVPPTEQRIKKGDLVNLTIKATSEDDNSNPLTFKWKFGNQTYLKNQLPAIWSYDPIQDQTFINTSKLSDKEYSNIGGIYTLSVFNLYDSKIHETNVILTDTKPPVPVTASAGMDMWIIGLIVGIIFLIVVIAIIIFVICRKQQEGDYNVDKKETGAGLDPEKELRDKGFNDLSRPDYDDYDFPEKKPRGDLEYDDVPIGGDDESLGEYGDEEDTHFNEDGSFIGIYQKKENERQNHKTESTI